MKWLVKRLSTAASMMVSVIHVAEQETLCRRGFWCNQNLSLTSAHCCIWSPAPAKSLSLSLSLSFLQMSPELKYGRFQLAWLFLSLALNAVCFDLRRWLGNNMHTLCSSKQCALTLFFFYIFSHFQSLLRLLFGSIQSKVCCCWAQRQWNNTTEIKSLF